MVARNSPMSCRSSRSQCADPRSGKCSLFFPMTLPNFSAGFPGPRNEAALRVSTRCRGKHFWDGDFSGISIFFFYEQAEYINDSHKEDYQNCVDKVDFFFEACQNADDKGKKRVML
ncbi:MAG: hypothetical protein B6245_01625 [Desulfobacteraceae bacterium 4572_88]|nr:MAG: hypothetical protein B6245_01625 [Desulfobacteraceae bacterium 4572_88]